MMKVELIMRKTFTLSVVIFLTVLQLCCAQNSKKLIYSTKEGSYPGQIAVNLCSEDILAYQLTICREAGKPIFEQKGYALIVHLGAQKYNGLDYEETVGTDTKPIPVRQYQVMGKCEKWLNIKLAKDRSLIEVDCGAELINELSGSKSINNLRSFHLGHFYRDMKNADSLSYN